MGFGSLLWGPLSEIVGRRQAFLVSFPFFVLLTLAAAVAKNVSTILAVRLLAGVFGAAQLPNMGGQMIDMWTPYVSD